MARARLSASGPGGPHSVTSSPGETSKSPTSTMIWSMHTRPTTGRRSPLSETQAF